MTAGDVAEQLAADLVALFHAPPPAFGSWESVAAEEVPEPARSLLDHRSHMTVAMERHHACPMVLRVVAERSGDDGDSHYAREILLARPDGVVVQHGIVRIDMAAVGPAAAAVIRSRSAPLGRILVEAGRLCDVHDVRLLRIMPGPHLALLLNSQARQIFGRVARIDVAGRPAVELLELVAPPAT
ncbi:MAG: hypothetical protein ACKOC8_04050 [Pirellulales bacterium]